MNNIVHCEVCGADITGMLSIDEDHIQRETCYYPEDCVDQLLVVVSAWKLLANGYVKHNSQWRNKALYRLNKIGQIELSEKQLKRIMKMEKV